MTSEEIKTFYNLKPLNTKKLRSLRGGISLDDFNDEDENTLTPRANIDWRPTIVMPIRDQGNCGSCWAFSTVAVVEAAWNKKQASTKPVLTGWLSTQQLMDCNTLGYSCNGGWFDSINYYKTNAAIYDVLYPYQQANFACLAANLPVTPVKATGYVYSYTADLLAASLANSAVAVAVDANNDWFNYASGVMNVTSCTSSVNHGVAVVGYDLANSAWIVRNSWSASWGEAGYIRISENVNNANSCGIATYGYRPTC